MEKLKVEFKDGKIREYPRGIRLADIAKDLAGDSYMDILIARVNNSLVELNDTVNQDCVVEFLTLSSYEARKIYGRGLTFVLIRAAEELYSGSVVTIEHSLNRGLYGEVHGIKEFGAADAAAIEKRMTEIIDADVPFEKRTVPLKEALDIFTRYDEKDKLRLFKYWKPDTVDLYRCGWMYDYFYGNMVPSTGYLRKFRLLYYKPGFLLLYPDIYNPDAVPELKDEKKLFNVFREAEDWGRILDVADVGALNDKVSSGEMQDMIRVSEALHEKKIARIADAIYERRDSTKIVLIAGPSSSGKTTFAKRLSVQLRVNGLRPYAISLDDYFLDRDKTPRDENGVPDFESIYALDIELLNRHLQKLLSGEEIEVPTFNFVTGRREYRGNKLRLTDDTILVVEGIHGLNEMLTSQIKPQNKFKVYVSALTQLNIDMHNRIPTTDVRILRRIVRDNRTRGRDAENTILGWPSVRRGEDRNIFPFQEEADIMFNSTLVYELGVLKRYAESLLSRVDMHSPAYSEAERLLTFLGYFLPVDEREVPSNSIIREFIGNSCFYDN